MCNLCKLALLRATSITVRSVIASINELYGSLRGLDKLPHCVNQRNTVYLEFQISVCVQDCVKITAWRKDPIDLVALEALCEILC